MEDDSTASQNESVEHTETEHKTVNEIPNTSIATADDATNDDSQIHNLSVQDVVTQIEIEQNQNQPQSIQTESESQSMDDNPSLTNPNQIASHSTVTPMDTNDPNLNNIAETQSKSLPSDQGLPSNEKNRNFEENHSPVQTTHTEPSEDNALHMDMDATEPKEPIGSSNSTDTDTDSHMHKLTQSREEEDDEEEEDEIDGRIGENGVHEACYDDDEDDISMKNCAASNTEDADDNFDPNAPCGVCWGAFDGDCLVYCDGCNVPLHQLCYSIREVPEGDYFCKVCQYQIDTAGKPSRGKDFLGRKCKCSICQLRFRSKKLAYTSQKRSVLDKKQKWCHVVCAQYISETWFDEDDTDLNGVCNVDDIRKERYEAKCTYCGRSKGAKVLCSILECKTRFHASCGLVNQCVLKDVADADDEYSNRVVYCPVHNPTQIMKGKNILLKKRLQQSQNLSGNANQNNMGWGPIWDAKYEQMCGAVTNRKDMQSDDDEDAPNDNDDADDEGYTLSTKKRRIPRKKARKTSPTKKKSKTVINTTSGRTSFAAAMGSGPPPLAPIVARRRGFFQATKPTGPRSMGAGPGHRAKKKFAANHKKRKEAPKLNGNSDIREPPKKKQRITPPHYNNNNKTSNPKLIPKRTMPKYSASPLSKERAKREQQEQKERERFKQESVKQMISKTAPKKFEQKGKVRVMRPAIASPITHSITQQRRPMPTLSSQDNLNHHRDRSAVVTIHAPSETPMHIQPPQQPPPPPPPHVISMPPPQMMVTSQPQHIAPPITSKVFPKRPNEIWNTRMIHEPERSKHGGSEIGKLDFKVTFVWRAGCQLEWPFANVSDANMTGSVKKVREDIHCAWKKDFGEIEKYMKDIRPGGKKQHLSHHWMLCEIHPYSTDDVASYGDFCNYYKDLSKVSAAMSKSSKHQHLLFYLCPPDETVLPETYLDDIFHCKIPKGLLWCLIFIKNLNLPGTANNVMNTSMTVPNVVHNNTVAKSTSKQQDPRKKHKEKRKKRHKQRETEEIEPEKSVSLGIEMDGSNLLGMLDSLQDTLKGEANSNDS